VRLNMQTKDGRRDIAVLSLTLSTAEAQYSIVSPAIFRVGPGVTLISRW
jgi:hypothetical protein